MPGATRWSASRRCSTSRATSSIDPGRYQNLTDDFSAQINAFKSAGCEIITGVMIPPDFTTFWNQAKQQGFKPKVASIGKALLFPQSVEALGKSANNLSSEVWWSPSHPFKSSLTGESSAAARRRLQQGDGPALDAADRLRPCAVRVGGRRDETAADPGDSAAVVAAIAATKLDTIVGPIAWNGTNLPPFAAKNVAKTPLVGGQWRLKDKGYELVIIDNKTAPEIPTGGTMEPIT